MKIVLLLAYLVSINSAWGTPGDHGCAAIYDGERLEMLLGYDVGGQDRPSLLELKINGQVRFSSSQVSLTSEPGNSTESAAQTVWRATSGEDSLSVRHGEKDSRYPTKISLSFNLRALQLTVNALEMNCDN